MKTLLSKVYYRFNNIQTLLFILGAAIVLFLYKNAFGVGFFLDDYFFLKIGRADSLLDIFLFFSPFKTYFYRPIPTELLYFFINMWDRNLFLSHTVVFIFYGIGIFYLYKVVDELSHNKVLAGLLSFLYAINFIHVFQLYQLATFIEICLFTFLIVSFFYYLKERYIISLLCFIGALMSKETAVLYPAIIFLFHFVGIVKFKLFDIKEYKKLIPYGIFSIIFYLIYRPSLNYLQATEPFYQLHLEPGLIANNLLWYGLWSLGAPNFLPVYLTSIFETPLPEFWNLLTAQQYKIYFYALILYYCLLGATAVVLAIRYRSFFKKYFSVLFLSGAAFFILIAPTLPTIHRWMVRLTMPLLFVVLIQALIIYYAYVSKGFLRIVSIILFVLYLTIQVNAIPIHEQSSVFLLQSSISKKAELHFEENRSAIGNIPNLYFIDITGKAWGGSRMLHNTLHDSTFLEIFFPGQGKKAYYQYRDTKIPKNSYVIDSGEILDRKDVK